MPVNRNALIRYKTIDKCLQNRYRKWTLEDLIDACSDALYEYEGIDKGVSRRTVQADIQIMRSDKLGYNAPIIVVDKKYYTYEDRDYSITNIPLSDQDLGMLSEAVAFMKQFQGFSHFRELDGMVQKLEDHIYAQKTHTEPVIDFEKNENLKGLEHLDPIYKAIIQKRAIRITYQSFKAQKANSFDFHPWLLKEFRNRWFVLGVKKKKEGVLNLALDRIIQLDSSEKMLVEDENFDAQCYFKDVIGVSVGKEQETEEVVFWVNRQHAPYVQTKPLHHSQKLIEADKLGMTFSIHVQLNFELEKELLGFGDGVKIISPNRLKRKIKDRLKGAIDLYDTELQTNRLTALKKQLTHKGFGIINYIYTRKHLNVLRRQIDRDLLKGDTSLHAQRQIFEKVPALKNMLFHKNLNRIIHSINPKAFLVKSMYFDKPPRSNWYVNWHQDKTIHLKERKEVAGYSMWTQKEGIMAVCPPLEVLKHNFTIRIHLDDTDAKNGCLRVIPGSHNKILTDDEIRLITESSIAYDCEVMAGGIQIMHPLLLHASNRTKNQKRRRVIHLEFSDAQLDGGLEWGEKFPLV